MTQFTINSTLVIVGSPKVLVMKELNLRSIILGFFMVYTDLLGSNLYLATLSLHFLTFLCYCMGNM